MSSNPLAATKSGGRGDKSGLIRTQCEFWFGDVNLRKDGFLKKKIEESQDGWVYIVTLLTFNRLKALSENIGLIARALKASTFLEVSSDSKRVRRRDQSLPGDDQEETDSRTLYFEGIPPDASHDDLYSVFSDYGTVQYLSLPRFDDSKKATKGFGFVEYYSQTHAQNSMSLEGRILPGADSVLQLMPKKEWLRLKKVCDPFC